MRGLRSIVGVVLLALGALALAYGGFNYTSETHDAKLGPLEIQLEERNHVEIPVWAGLAAVAAGGAVLLIGERRRG